MAEDVGPSAACEHGGYGTGKEPYEDLPAGPIIEVFDADITTVLGTAPITEFTANVGVFDTKTSKGDGRRACIKDGSDLV